jgi:hypothetical protein
MYTSEFNSEQKVSVLVKPVTAKGKPANLTDTPAWVSDDLAIVEPVVDEGGLSGFLLGVAEGAVNVTISGTNILGVVISVVVGCTVTAAPAGELVLELGAPIVQ